MKVTQTDIANRLGISRLTVSKALNNENGVSERTKQAVIETAIEMRYIKIGKMHLDSFGTDLQNSSGNQLIANKQITLFLILGLDSDSYWAPVIRGMTTILSEYGYQLNLCFLTATDGDYFEFPPNFKPKETEGIIQFGNFSKKQMDQLMATNLPLVSIDKTMYEDGKLFCDTVMCTNKTPTIKMVKHLFDSGYRKIGYARDGHTQLTMNERWLGYLQGMEEVGLKVDPSWCFSGGFDEIIAKIEDEKRLENFANFPDAIMCCNDMQAISFLQYFNKQQIKIPEMVALTGHDNIRESEVAGLTTIHVDKEELGKSAAELILWRIRNPERPYRMVRMYDYELIFRDTSKIIVMQNEKE